jgi:hypothetical protein
LARRAQAAYSVLAHAPAAERARYVLRPAERAAMVEAALWEGLRAADGALVEVVA